MGMMTENFLALSVRHARLSSILDFTSCVFYSSFILIARASVDRAQDKASCQDNFVDDGYLHRGSRPCHEKPSSNEPEPLNLHSSCATNPFWYMGQSNLVTWNQNDPEMFVSQYRRLVGVV